MSQHILGTNARFKIKMCLLLAGMILFLALSPAGCNWVQDSRPYLGMILPAVSPER